MMSAVPERVLPRRRLPGFASRLRLRPCVSSRPRTYPEVEVAMVIATLAVWLLVSLHVAEAQLQTRKVWHIGVLTALYPPDADPPQATSKDRTSSSSGDTLRAATTVCPGWQQSWSGSMWISWLLT